jgi:hypothetical protein
LAAAASEENWRGVNEAVSWGIATVMESTATAEEADDSY